MSIKLNVRDWDDEEYDDCGNTAVAILKVGQIKIPLCMDCVNELQESINDFCRPQYCYQCKHFKTSQWGWKYGGSCCKDEDVLDTDVGYRYCKDCMNSCKSFVEKENNNETN